MLCAAIFKLFTCLLGSCGQIHSPKLPKRNMRGYKYAQPRTHSTPAGEGMHMQSTRYLFKSSQKDEGTELTLQLL